MDFQPTEAEQAARDLAARIIADHAGPDRAGQLEAAARAGGSSFDRPLWEALGAAGLFEALTGGDETLGSPGVVAASLIAEEVGRHVATVPAWAGLGGLLALRRLAPAPVWERVGPGLTSGRDLATLALHEVGRPRATEPATTADDDGRLTGTKPTVPELTEAAWVLVPVVGSDGEATLFLVDPSGPSVTTERTLTTDRGVSAHLGLGDAAGEAIGRVDAVEWVEQVATTLVCATLVGLCEQALRSAVDYIVGRHQFGRSIASFQGPVLRVADGSIDIDAMRVTMLQAAWRLDTGRDAAGEVAVAKWWAAKGGHRLLHTTQHLHGGIGADVEYPIHRFFIRGKQLTDTLGGASVQADRLGRLVAAGARP